MKKLLALVLVLLMVVPFMAACNSSDNGKKPVSTNSGTETDAGENDPADTDPLMAEIDEYIEELSTTYADLKGKTFTNFGIGWEAPSKDEETGDVMSDAYYFRQREIEDAFQIDWVNALAGTSGETSSATVEEIKQDVLAGVGAYDASYGNGMHCQNLLINDCLYDMSIFEALDFDREWWPESLLDDCSIMGALYFLNGPIISSFYQDGSCVLFNKQVAEDYGLEDVYAIVRDGDWTWDKMFEVAACVPENANGSGAYRYANPNGPSTIMSHDIPLTLFDENGKPYYADSVPSDIFEIADKFSKIFSDGSQTVNLIDETGSPENLLDKYGYEDMEDMFADEKMLFMFTTTATAANLRTLDVNFGILPFPKGSDTQEDYVSAAHYNGFRDIFVPASIKDPHKTDVVLEAMAALGYKHFKPVFYDTILKGRTVKDFESKEMIDIIFNTKRFDLLPILDKGADMNTYGEITNLYRNGVEDSADTLTSKYFIKSKIVNSNITNILKNIEAANQN